MDHNRLKAKEEILYHTHELIQALSDADLNRAAKAREEILRNADIVFAKEEEKLNTYKIVAASYNGAYNQGEALPIVKKIVKITRAVYPKNSPEQIEAYDMLAYTLLAAGECEQALQLAEELKRFYTGKYGREDRKTMKMTALVGRIWWKMGKFQDGYDVMQEAYEAAKEAFGPADIDTLNYRRELVMCSYYLGNGRQAYKDMLRIYEVCLHQYGEGHTITLKTSQNLLQMAKELENKSQEEEE